MALALKALRNLSCSVKFWTDSRVVYKWISNPELHLTGFVKRRVDRIHMVSSSDAWGYINTSLNPADVATREKNLKNPDLLNLCLKPEFLLQEAEDPQPFSLTSSVHHVSLPQQKSCDGQADSLNDLFKVAPDLYTSKKRLA